MDLEPGTVLLYGSGAEHTGIDPAGLEFVFTTVELDSLNETASHLELRQPSVPRGHVYALAPVAEVRFLATVLQSIQAQLFSDSITAAVRRTTVEALAVALSPEFSSRSVGGRRAIDDLQIVRRCIEYSETINRPPSTTELSHAAFVSERRLRDAFTNVSGLPPHKYFRRRALTNARRRLTSGTKEQMTVSGVAMDLGFYNLGRFAAQYRQFHGEPPPPHCGHSEVTRPAVRFRPRPKRRRATRSSPTESCRNWLAAPTHGSYRVGETPSGGRNPV